jgi:hypothetical protein
MLSERDDDRWPRPAFCRMADLTGDGTGSISMAVNGSVTPVTFKVAPAAGEIIIVRTIVIYVQDTGNFSPTTWGNGVTMANGMLLQAYQNGVLATINAHPCATSGDLAGIIHDINYQAFGTGDNVLTGRLDFKRTFGQGLRLDGDNSDELRILIRDDLTALSEQHVTVQGYYAAS